MLKMCFYKNGEMVDMWCDYRLMPLVMRTRQNEKIYGLKLIRDYNRMDARVFEYENEGNYAIIETLQHFTVLKRMARAEMARADGCAFYMKKKC